MKIKQILSLVLFTAVLFAFTACAGGPAETTAETKTAETKADEKKETLKESYKEPASIFQEPVFNATRMAKMKQGGR